MKSKKIEQGREMIISAGIKNLTEYGYHGVTAENILTDEIYSAFFLSMLKYNLGKGLDGVINQIINEINEKVNQ